MTQNEAIAKAVEILEDNFGYCYFIDHNAAIANAEMMTLLSGSKWKVYSWTAPEYQNKRWSIQGPQAPTQEGGNE